MLDTVKETAGMTPDEPPHNIYQIQISSFSVYL